LPEKEIAMSSSPEDPRLTAYVLGELGGAERATFEAELLGDTRTQAEVVALKHTAERLGSALSRPSELSLSAEQRGQLRARFAARRGAPPPNHGVVPIRRRWRRLGYGLGVALPAAAALWLLLRPAAEGELAEAYIERAEVESDGSGTSAPERSASDVGARVAESVPGWVGESGTDLFLEQTEDPLASSIVAVGHRKRSEDRVRGLLADTADRATYSSFDDGAFRSVRSAPLSTFAVDVDTASYALVRRHLSSGQRPPRDAVRIEELINYFEYDYPAPTGTDPVGLSVAVTDAPWAPGHRLLRVALRAKDLPSARPPANLVFLVDVSGSMADADKLPFVKHGLGRLVEDLSARDRVSIVVYAGDSGVLLEPTTGDRREAIRAAIDRLEAGGNTNGSGGIELAYDLAARNYRQGGINRVILATDGDFNVGVTNPAQLRELIERRAKSGVYLSVLGYGQGNLNDAALEALADHGNGHYAYIDRRSEAERVLVEQATRTLVTVAKDVKVQVELNPGTVERYRLIGYENRRLTARDFHDDTKDAGDMGAGQRVTALYEVVLAPRVASGAEAHPAHALGSGLSQKDLLAVHLRFQGHDGGSSTERVLAVQDEPRVLEGDLAFAAAVAELGMLLRRSPERGASSYEQVLLLARAGLGSGHDREARAELIDLVERARGLESLPVEDPLHDDLP
jgi:Ca-activated chloride channel homolog